MNRPALKRHLAPGLLFVFCLAGTAGAAPASLKLKRGYPVLLAAGLELTKSGSPTEPTERAVLKLCPEFKSALGSKFLEAKALVKLDEELCYALRGEDGCENGRPYWARVLLRSAISRKCGVGTE